MERRNLGRSGEAVVCLGRGEKEEYVKKVEEKMKRRKKFEEKEGR